MREIKIKNMKLKAFLEKISYESRHALELKKHTERYEQYLKMEEAEFIMEYTTAMAKYAWNKNLFNISWFTIAGSVFIFLSKYIVHIRSELEAAYFSSEEIKTIFAVNFTVVGMVLLATFFISCIILKHTYAIAKEKTFMEAIKSLRAERK